MFQELERLFAVLYTRHTSKAAAPEVVRYSCLRVKRLIREENFSTSAMQSATLLYL